MKKTFFSIMLCAVCMTMTAGTNGSDPAIGYWVSIDDKTGKETAAWFIYEAGGVLYGKMVSVAGYPQNIKAVRCKDTYKNFPLAGKVSDMLIVGTPWIYGLLKQAEGQWIDGSIINPEDGNIYKSKITFHAADGKKYKVDTLEMRGEIGLGLGRSQFWKKTTKEAAEALR